MSLADQIYEGNTKERHPLDLGYEDELGLEVFDNVDYLVARALAISERDRESEFTTNQLHIREGRIWLGSKRVIEGAKAFYQLTEYDKHVKTFRQELFWKRLKQFLPHLDASIYQITDNLFWDRPSGELITRKELDEKLKTQR